MTFELKITDIFRLSDGRTVFSGRILSRRGLIGRCQCELRTDAVLRQVILCEGEQIIKKRDPKNDLRAIATLEKVNLSAQEAQSGQWKLVGSG